MLLPSRPNLILPPGDFFFFFFFFITLGLELSDTKFTSLNYEPSLELVLITAKQLFLNRELYRSVQLSPRTLQPPPFPRCATR